jgi:tetratricopeptide (TPR) repeat protein
VDPSEADPGRPGSRKWLARIVPWLLAAGLLGATAWAYAPSLRGPFILDDFTTVENNMALRRPEALRLPGLARMLGTTRPVTEATLVADFRAAGLDPRRYRTVSLLLHLAATVAAFLFVRSLARRAGHPRAVGVAFAAAGAFALHPVQVDAVAYVSQRAEVLSSALYLVTLLLLDSAVARLPGTGGMVRWAAGVVSWVVAMGAKAIAISAPGAFLIDQVIVGGPAKGGLPAAGRRALKALVVAAPVVVLAAWSASLQVRAMESNPAGAAGFTATPLSAGQYLMTQMRVHWLYLRLLAWPGGYAFDRAFEPSLSPDASVLAAGAGIAAMVGVALWLWMRAGRREAGGSASRLVAFGILFWLVALSPTSSFVPVMDLAVEHRVYLAALGPILAAVAVADAILHRLLAPRAAARVSAIAVAMALLVLGGALRARARTWGSADAFWQAAVAATPGSARIWTNLGLSLQRRGDLGGAEAAYRRGWAVARGANAVVPLAGNLAALLVDLGREGEALQVLDAALPLAPENSGLRVNRAVALGRTGRVEEALADARRAVASAPADPRMQNVLGIAQAASGDLAAAVATFQAAEALDPGVPDYPISAAACLAAMGRRDEACAVLHRVAARSAVRPLPLGAEGRAAALGCPIPKG